MDIETPSSTPYYVPSNKNIPSNPKIPIIGNNQNRNFQPQQPNNNYSGMMNHSQNVSNNFSQMNMANSYNPQMQNRTINGDQYNYQPNRQSNQNQQYMNNSQNFSYQNNPYQNNFQNNNSQYQFQNNNSAFVGRGQMQQPQPCYSFP